ncbi:proteoglycan 4 [Monomorium pharaonis]|uniref:proteoglycan 4 n=1 Tax=Monomorium pharaonis TaxID=307658 RepID=UPI00063F10D4|nr:proteoglycan 4 [Monomorium pharaonis]XP_036139574.1 proteoglycan 4 [Monomorium pharaonis]
MRMQLLKIVVVLLAAGSGDTRPQNGADPQAKMTEGNDEGWRGIQQVSSKSHDIVRDDSSKQLNNTHRELKDLQYMDQSLRTVATQLLNVTNPQDVMKVNNKEIINTEYDVVTTLKPSEKNNAPLLIRNVNSAISHQNLEPVSVSYGRPINSKFSYFESSHPGQAMAITEEELEREMSTTRLITAYKNQPTTTGGISTWILLNPPSTTAKSVTETEKMKTQQPFQTEVRLTVRPSSSIEKMETISQPEKITEKTTPLLTPIITTEKVTVITKKPTATTTKKTATTLRPEKVTQNSETEKTETSSSTTLKVIRTTTTSTSTTSDGTATLTTVLTTKKSQPPRTTSKPKVTTPRTTSHPNKPTTTKPSTAKPARPKPTRKTTAKPETNVKNETTASTGKIEKVTFKPVPIITTPQNKPENTEKPTFVTKIKASVLMDTQKTPTNLLPTTTATTLSASSNTFKPNSSNAGLVEVPVRSKPIGTKNNVLKAQLKKPVDETTRIEIEPIKVNTPVLKIEKIDKNKMDEIVLKDTDDFSNSKIDLKFDFNPELTKINVETQTETTGSTLTNTASTPTTKRPRHNSKRKKNKRRRKPSRTSVLSSTTNAMVPILMETNGESVTDSTIMDNAVQESKIAPETKVGTNTTKTKKKQPQKGISTHIYNFLSREVMPSFGVMSLVGLGIGLASYLLYPFGGTITRRNYEVEPNYKYNMDEYGGNYGQREEEMLSKVFQGMTSYENKYPGEKDNYNDNYYQYQHYDGAYNTAQTTKKVDVRYPSISTSPVYKTAENTQPAVKYRNTDYRYPDVQTTPVYYDRKRPDLTVEVGAGSAANRQFVVGNVPKEYPYDVKVANVPVDSGNKGVGYMSTEVGEDTQYERDVAQSYDFANVAGLHGYGHLGASTVRSDDGYEEIEITPTAVAVEHGPRSLKIKRAALDEAEGSPDGRRSRTKRESVIQIIPTKRELEEEREEVEKEEDLSNEILDIIDSALPGGAMPHKRGSGENNEVEDLEGQRKRQQEEANTRMKESTLKAITTEDTTEFSTTGRTDDGGTSVSSENTSDRDTTTHPTDLKNPEDPIVEWFNNSTTEKPPSEGFSLINFVKKVAEIKFRLGLTILKHASEGFARYLGHVQKRINGEE